MARIRTIKPDFFTNEGMSSVPETAQLLAGGLICYADDEGYFNANPGLVKAAVFPLRDPSMPVEDCLKALVGIGYIRLGNGSDGKRYGHIVKFAEHQKVSHLTPSKIKKMEIVWEVSRKPPEYSVRTTEPLRPELNRIELNRTEKNLEPSPHKTRRVVSNSAQLAMATGEKKYTRIAGMLIAAWNEHNPGAKCPFGDPDGKQLKILLGKTSGWADSNYAQCLQNMYATEGFPRSELPMHFLPKLPSYFSGPKDRFNREQGHGSTGKTVTAERNNRNLEAIVSVALGDSVRGNDVPDRGAVPPRTECVGERHARSVPDPEVLAREPVQIKPAANAARAASVHGFGTPKF